MGENLRLRTNTLILKEINYLKGNALCIISHYCFFAAGDFLKDTFSRRTNDNFRISWKLEATLLQEEKSQTMGHSCLVVKRADSGIKSESSRVDYSSSVTVKKRRENILPAIKVLTFEKLDVNHCRGQRVNLQVDLIAKKITSTGNVPYWFFLVEIL